MHKQQSRGELSRHTWHRQESDESSESVNEDVEAARNFPRSSTFPCATTSHQQGEALQSGSQRRFGGTSGIRNDCSQFTRAKVCLLHDVSDNLCLSCRSWFRKLSSSEDASYAYGWLVGGEPKEAGKSGCSWPASRPSARGGF